MSGAVEFYGFEFSSRSAASPQLNASQRCFKLTIIVVNVIFLLFGCISCALGAYAVNSEAGILAGAGLPNAIIAIGVFIIVMALMGCAAAWFETRLGLSIYFIVLLILCLLSFLLGIGVLIEKNEARSLLVSGWRSSPVPAQTAIADAFQCCGFTQYCDNCQCANSAGSFSSTFCTDQQCTIGDNTNVTRCDFTCPSSSKRSNTPVCVDVLQDSFEGHYQQLGGASIAFGVLMFFAMAIVCVLMRGIKQKAYLEQVRAQHRRIREAKEERTIDLTGIQTGLESPRYVQPSSNQSNHQTNNQYESDDDDDDDDLEEARPNAQFGRPISQSSNQITQSQRGQPIPQYDDDSDEDDEEEYQPQRPQQSNRPSNNQSNNQSNNRPPPPSSRAPPRQSRRPPSDDDDDDDEDFS